MRGSATEFLLILDLKNVNEDFANRETLIGYLIESHCFECYSVIMGPLSKVMTDLCMDT